MAGNRRHLSDSTNKNSSKPASGRMRSSKRVDVRENGVSKESTLNLKYLVLIIGLAIAIGVIHRNHVANMFERDRHFSHLSTLERELTFRTEMGLYYSYFKTIIKSPSFFSGLQKVMFDNVTEYPTTINVLKRFNLYPEVVLALAYRTLHNMRMLHMTCWRVNRDGGMPPVQSCEGMGEPAYFYLEVVYMWNGVMMAVFFLFGTYLSGSIFGGLITVICFFYNHGECTRVQWTPPLRESFAYPCFVIQMFLLTYILRSERPSHHHSVSLALAVAMFMLPWQFAQFALLTQTLAVFGTYVLGFVDAHKLKVILTGQLLGLGISYVFLFGNEMLLTSFFASCLVSLFVIVWLEPLLEKLKVRVLIWALQGIILIAGTIGFKMILAKIFQVADDAHIRDIFKSKFTDFQNFHTMLYTCAAEFDFMQMETFWKLLQTLLLPAAGAAVLLVLYTLIKNEYVEWKNAAAKKPSSGKEAESIPTRSKPHAELVYHLLQLVAFTVMAVLIMRLKLFWTPHLCLLASLLASRQLLEGVKREVHFAVLVAMVAAMSYQGIANLQHQWSIIGEFSNYPLEEMVEWIKANTSSVAVFGGPMPTMATVKLCTERPIVNHPHYEDAGLRARTMLIYSMYSRKSVKEVHSNYRTLQVDYAVLEESWCFRRTRPGCSMPEVWDVEDKENVGKTPVCSQLKEKPGKYFKTVFQNNVYVVLKVMPV